MIIQNEIITSRQNPAVKWAASLQSKKGREESGCFLAEGEKYPAGGYNVKSTNAVDKIITSHGFAMDCAGDECLLPGDRKGRPYADIPNILTVKFQFILLLKANCLILVLDTGFCNFHFRNYRIDSANGRVFFIKRGRFMKNEH